MQFHLRAGFLCSVVVPLVVAAQTSANDASGPTIPLDAHANPELLRMVIADQWERGNDMFGKGQVRDPSTLDWKTTAQHDAQRHEAVRALMAAGEVKTANDFKYASLIFQHSAEPSDLMLAHVLSTTAYGMTGAGRWMMAATMDRYLQAIHQPQIFGTQFLTKDGGHTWTMEPYDRSSVSDAERALWCVVPLAQQGVVLEGYQSGKPGGSTQLPGCR